MTQLTYVSRRFGKFLDVEFNRAPSQTVCAELRKLGFIYNSRYRCWRGTRNHEAALDLCERAVTQSGRVIATHEKEEQLCWTCASACGGCSWSDGTLTPVPGWTATPYDRVETLHKSCNGRDIIRRVPYKSYTITACPQYRPDPPRRAKDTCKTSVANRQDAAAG